MKTSPLSSIARATALLVLVSVPATARGPYQEGQQIEITGTAIDASGEVVPGLRIVLRASRVGWSFRAINLEERGRTVKDTTERTATTDSSGRFTIPWRWHDYYNRFELAAGTVVRRGETASFRQLAAIDLTSRIRQGSPVVTSFTIDDPPPAAATAPPARTDAPAPSRPAPSPPSPSSSTGRGPFERAVTTPDERRIFDQLGEPDDVDVFDGARAQEVTWWYFRLGRAYRFVDGFLDETSSFDPVEPF